MAGGDQPKSEDKARVLQAFLTIEREETLFDKSNEGIYYWELVRYQLYSKLLSSLGLQSVNETGSRNYFDWISYSLLQSITGKSPSRAKKNSLLFFGHPRKKKENDLFVDIYTDPFIHFLSDNYEYSVLEGPLRPGFHCEPAYNYDVLYIDYLLLRARTAAKLERKTLSQETIRVCTQVQSQLEMKTGIQLNILSYIAASLARYQHEFTAFKKLFLKTSPKAVFIVVSTDKEALIAAARSLSIPTIELQHGSPAKGKLNYDYPNNILKDTFPDYFFSFGEYWTRSVNFPISEDRIIPVGFPYMELKKDKYRETLEKKLDQIVFISQPTVFKDLATLALNVAEKANNKYKIIYKMHPLEYDHFPELYNKLLHSGIHVYRDVKVDLYSLLAESKWQVGVYSTALYEGIAFSCITYILNTAGAEHMKPVIDNQQAFLINDADELLHSIDMSPDAPDGAQLFSPVDKDRLHFLIDKICRHEKELY